MTKRKDPKDLKKRGPKEKFTKEEVLSWESEYLASASQGMSDRVFLGKKGLERHYMIDRAKRDMPELTTILEKAKAIREEFYTKMIVAGMAGKLKGFNLGAAIWLTKHMLGWWDQNPTEIDVSLGQGNAHGKVVFKSRFASENEKE